MACGPFFFRPRAVRMHLDAGAVKPRRLELHAHDSLPPQVLEHAVQNAVLRPPAHPRVYGVPVAETFRKPPPLAAVPGHMEDRVEHLEVRHAHVSALPRQQRRDPFKLRLGEFHDSDFPPLSASKTMRGRIPCSGPLVLTRSRVIYTRDREAANAMADMLPVNHKGVDWALGGEFVSPNDALLADLGDPATCAEVLRRMK